jgi:uncharacterized membrane protein YkoI
MNTSRLRSKRVVIPTAAAVAVLGVGGVVWTTTASADIRGDERDRVVAAVGESVPGTVVDVESGDQPGEAYEVDVRQDDGTEVEVILDADLQVLREDVDRPDDDGDDLDDRTADDTDDTDTDDTGTDDVDGTPDADDRALSAEERSSAEAAALAAVDGGTTVLHVEADDDGPAYEVEVRAADGRDWDVDLAADFSVLSTSLDD